MLKINTGYFVPKYRNGKWCWNETDERLQFDPRVEAMREDIINTGGFRFLAKLNQVEENIFRQEFQRRETTHDADFILIQDIMNLVLFLAPGEILSKEFVCFVHTRTVYNFMHALIIYFEYYLKMVEFVLIRRDEITGDKAQTQSQDSNEIKRIYSGYLSQYRLLLAREYSVILLGDGEMQPFYHITPIVNISKSIKDKAFHEGFLAYCTQVVWISMHRRAYDYIDLEMNRLFRSEHFKLNRHAHISFSKVEASILYGKNYKRVNYRVQTSPLIQELASVAQENQPILWIGERKYRGNDFRIHALELEFIVPDSQLSLIDVSHGILGHPKKLYNTLLNLDWAAVRFQNYSEVYDPYRLVRQPYLEIPRVDEEKLRKQCQKYEHFYKIKSHQEDVPMEVLRKWKRRDQLIERFKNDEKMIVNVLTKSEYEAKRETYGPSVEVITRKFLERKEKLLKKHTHVRMP